MAEDTPDDVLHMELLDAVFPGHPLGRETLGSRDTIESLGRDAIAGFERDHEVPDEPESSEPRWALILRDVADRLPVSRRQSG